MAEGRWRKVKQGESVESICQGTGHLPETLWKAPENQDLAKLRKSPHLLAPGDRLFVPPVKPKVTPVATGQRHTFKRKALVSRLKLQLLLKGKPRANESFVLTIDDDEISGSTDGDGAIDVPVPVGAKKATLVVGQGDDETTYPLRLRALDPSDTPSGLQGRLRNLGYNVGPVDSDVGVRTRRALMCFQLANQLDPTGEPDDKTRAKLVEVHGS